jgi:hypothetical protein
MRQVDRLRLRWEDNIKVGLKHIEYENVYGNQKVKNRIKSCYFATFGCHERPEVL